MDDINEEYMNITPPPRPRPPSIAFALPPLPTFESTWDFSQFRRQSPSSPQLPTRPSPTGIATAHSSPSKLYPAPAVNTSPWPEERRKAKMSCVKAPPLTPRLQPVQPLNDQAMRSVGASASLSLHITKSSTDLTSVPGLADSVTSASCSSDEHEHHSDNDTDEDPYLTSTNNAWDSYYTPEEEVEDPCNAACEQSYILPSAESCYALGFGKLGCPDTPSPVKNPSPLRRPSRPSPTRTRTAAQPASVRPSMSVRRYPSGRSTKSSRTITQSRFNASHNFQASITRTNTSATYRTRQAPSPALSFSAAHSTSPPSPMPRFPFHPLPPLPPLPSNNALRLRYPGDPRFSTDRGGDRGGDMGGDRGVDKRLKSPPADYIPPYLSLFPMSSRHSTPNGEMPPWPVPSRRAPRPVTAPAARSIIAPGTHASTTVLGGAGCKVVVERSVWEADSDDEEEDGEYKGRKSMGKWHLRTGSSSSKGSVGKGEGNGSMRKKEGGKEREKWGKRSASDVVRSLFTKHSGH